MEQESHTRLELSDAGQPDQIHGVWLLLIYELYLGGRNIDLMSLAVSSQSNHLFGCTTPGLCAIFPLIFSMMREPFYR